VPTAQVFPFDASLDWPKEIGGRKMETYHEWMKGVLPVTMAGGPALAVPAGFNQDGRPIGIQIVGPNHADLACLQLARAYERQTNWTRRRAPPLLDAALRRAVM
jgi:amidase